MFRVWIYLLAPARPKAATRAPILAGKWMIVYCFRDSQSVHQGEQNAINLAYMFEWRYLMEYEVENRTFFFYFLSPHVIDSQLQGSRRVQRKNKLGLGAFCRPVGERFPMKSRGWLQSWYLVCPFGDGVYLSSFIVLFLWVINCKPSIIILPPSPTIWEDVGRLSKFTFEYWSSN